MTPYISELLQFIERSPSPFHAVDNVCRRLRAQGFQPLPEAELWKLEPGGCYYVTRNLSSCIAFRLPEEGKPRSFLLTASHSDSPTFKLKENYELASPAYTRLNVERYGGMLYAPWFDRPLSVAGRLLVRRGNKLETRLVALDKDVAVIPNVAIHMNRKLNDGYSFAPQQDLIPLLGGPEAKGMLKRLLAGAADAEPEAIAGSDLTLYLREPGRVAGLQDEFVLAPRLDDLECAFGTLEGFLQAGSFDACPVYCLFDNEEVGSATRQGADSSFLSDVLTRLAEALGMSAQELRAAAASSLMLSADNAHAVHPNHPELSDPENQVVMNGGIVVKFNANQRYTSDGVSSALFREICRRAGVPTQAYANRSDMPGGSTLGNIANTHVSLHTVDIGLAQLAMHSCFETAGTADVAYLVQAAKAFYETSLRIEGDGTYLLSRD
ncbi:MAG: M18 family aminopeptidase [Provencibacterium sp.]|jgi:aspartyl aminopeptidase|nr:M18 family aminopeptidase [Provencibacterium sp.]